MSKDRKHSFIALCLERLCPWAYAYLQTLRMIQELALCGRLHPSLVMVGTEVRWGGQTEQRVTGYTGVRESGLTQQEDPHPPGVSSVRPREVTLPWRSPCAKREPAVCRDKLSKQLLLLSDSDCTTEAAGRPAGQVHPA